MIKEILLQFCDSVRNDLIAPINIGEYTYASNGHIAIKVPRDSQYKENAVDYLKVLPTFFVSEKEDLYIDVPKIEPSSIEIKCKSCDGTGKFNECTDCGGTGEVNWSSDSGYEYYDDCVMCGGTGRISGSQIICEDCNGVGKINEDKIVELFDPIWINARLLSIVAKLPNVKMAPNVNKPLSPIQFKFDGGMGLIMPCRKPQSTKEEKC